LTLSATFIEHAPLERPFATTANPRYFALLGQYKTALNRAIATVVEREGLAIVAGPVGSGKSTTFRYLIDWMAENLGSSVNLVYLSNPSYSTDLQLLKAVCKELELPLRPKRSEQMDELKAFLADEDAKGKVTVLLVDEAHRLNGVQFELIRELFNFSHNERFHIQVILAGEDKPLQHKLKNKKAILSRAMYHTTLLPLSADEVAELVRFRLRVAGLAEDLFTAEAVEAIAKVSRGVPRAVVKIARHAFADIEGTSNQVTLAVVERALAGSPQLAYV
jgi:general secretion pathway protein A